MKSIITLLLTLFIGTLSEAATRPNAMPADLMIQRELDPRIATEAKHLARSLGLPERMYFPQGVFVEPYGIEEGRPVYIMISNPAHPLEGAEAVFYENVQERLDMRDALINYDGPVVPNAGEVKADVPQVQVNNSTGWLLVPDWTSDRVIAFDPQTGDLLNANFIPTNNTAMDSPKEARPMPRRGTISVSDQIRDAVQEFDTSGAWLGIFAPAGGVNNAILDNIRGHAYRPDNRHLLVTVASGANQNAIAEFDSAGNYLGRFIEPASGGSNSPFAILFRQQGDVLITTSSSPIGVHRYNMSGTFLGTFATISSFPQQLIELPDGRIAVANFLGTGTQGIRLYAPDGTFLRVLQGVIGNRGVYQLPSGNFLTTNAAGIHEIDSTTGNLVRTILTGANFQYVNLVVPDFATSVGQEGNMPVEFVLKQNYPNPFNPSTVVEYSVPVQSIISLKVFDLLGREVTTLAEGAVTPGVHRTFWNGRLSSGAVASSGVYYYRLEGKPLDGNNVFVATRRLVFIR
jgi:DNA-binding beta-propeller fold protein YncE